MHTSTTSKLFFLDLLLKFFQSSEINFSEMLLSFFDVAGTNAGGEIAHLGGAFIGYIFIRQLQNGINIGEGIINFLNLFNEKKKEKKNKFQKESDETTQDEVDKILDKISESGYSSLTSKEKERLFNASKKQ